MSSAPRVPHAASSGRTPGSSTRCTGSSWRTRRACRTGWREFFADYRPVAPSVPGARRAAGRAAPRPPHPRRPRQPAAPGAGRARRRDGRAAARRRGADRRRTWRRASRCRRRRRCARCRPSCSRSTARSSTTTSRARGGGKVSFTHLIGYAVLRALRKVPVDELQLRRRRRQAQRRAPRARQPRPRDRPREGRRVAHAARPERQAGRHARLRRASTPRTKISCARARNNKLTPDDFARHHRVDHQPRHDRHDALGAAAHAGAGRDRRRRRDHLPARVRGRRPADARRARRRQGRRRSRAPTTTASSRARRAASSSPRCTTCCVGGDGFYDEIFESLAVPYEPARWIAGPPAARPARSKASRRSSRCSS